MYQKTFNIELALQKQVLVKEEEATEVQNINEIQYFDEVRDNQDEVICRDLFKFILEKLIENDGQIKLSELNYKSSPVLKNIRITKNVLTQLTAEGKVVFPLTISEKKKDLLKYKYEYICADFPEFNEYTYKKKVLVDFIGYDAIILENTTERLRIRDVQFTLCDTKKEDYNDKP